MLSQKNQNRTRVKQFLKPAILAVVMLMLVCAGGESLNAASPEASVGSSFGLQSRRYSKKIYYDKTARSNLEARMSAQAAAALASGQIGQSTTTGDTVYRVGPNPQGWFHRQFLTGDWGGMRNELYDDGFTVNASIVADLLGNVTGGRSQGFEPAESFGMEFIFDLEKMGGVTGTPLEVLGMIL